MIQVTPRVDFDFCLPAGLTPEQRMDIKRDILEYADEIDPVMQSAMPG